MGATLGPTLHPTPTGLAFSGRDTGEFFVVVYDVIALQAPRKWVNAMHVDVATAATEPTAL